MRRRCFLGSAAALTVGGSYSAEKAKAEGASSKFPLVGAIRWDAWYDDSSDIDKDLEKELAPKEFHYRLPFFSVIDGDGGITIDGNSQYIIDKEIELASAAGIDYWAFDAYPQSYKSGSQNKPYSMGRGLRLISQQQETKEYTLLHVGSDRIFWEKRPDK